MSLRTIPLVMAAPSDDGRGHEAAMPPASSDIRASLWVGEDAIDENEIAREMQHHRRDDPYLARADAARALVVRELLRREADRLGLTATVVPMPGETHEEACIRVLMDREIASVVVDRETCQRYYEQNRESLRSPDHIRLRHILLAASPDDAHARLATLAQAEALIADLRTSPEHFAEYAARHSACPSRDKGGELGWVGRGGTTAEFERQVFMLHEGLASAPVESRYGHHVVVIDEIRRGSALSFEQALPRITARLEMQATRNAMRQYIAMLSDRHGVRGLQEIEAQAA